jgi:hypothetical protein
MSETVDQETLEEALREADEREADVRWRVACFALGFLLCLIGRWIYDDIQGDTAALEASFAAERKAALDLLSQRIGSVQHHVGLNEDFGYACPAPKGCWAVARKDTVWLNPMPEITGGHHVFYGQPQPPVKP